MNSIDLWTYPDQNWTFVWQSLTTLDKKSYQVMHLLAKYVVGQVAKIAWAYFLNKFHPKHCFEAGIWTDPIEMINWDAVNDKPSTRFSRLTYFFSTNGFFKLGSGLVTRMWDRVAPDLLWKLAKPFSLILSTRSRFSRVRCKRFDFIDWIVVDAINWNPCSGFPKLL